MANEPLQVIAPDRRKHLAEMLDLCAKVFSNRGYYRFLDHCRKGYVEHSHYDWSASRIGLMDGKIVTHWGVWGLQMRVGSCAVRVGGIGLVATHGDYRKRGLMAITAPQGIEAMQALGYDLSILYGIDNYYDRLGYVRAWGNLDHTVATGELPADKPAFKVRKFNACHRPELADLYNRDNEGLTGTSIRPTYLRNGSPMDFRGHLWTDAKGKIVGYVIHHLEFGNRRRLICADSAGEPEQVLRVMGLLARQDGCDEVRFHCLHNRSALARYIRRGTVRLEAKLPRNGGPMVRTLNLSTSLEKIAPELSRRLAESTLADWKGQLLMADSRQKATLEIARGKVKVAPAKDSRHAIRGGDHIAQLLIGTADPMETAGNFGIKFSGDGGKLVQALFPAQEPMLAGWDFF